MTPLGMPLSMFLVFAATVLAGSLGAIHYVVAHVILGRPFAEIPPPVVEDGAGPPQPEGKDRKGGSPERADG